MDVGWVRDPEDDNRWVLLDAGGEQVAATYEALRRMAGQAAADRCLARAGWPPLPARPDLVCLLEHGPHDGRWWFLPLDVPPEGLSFARPQPARAAAAGVRVTGLVGGYDRYVLAGQPCGDHGRGCPYVYRWDPAS